MKYVLSTLLLLISFPFFLLSQSLIINEIQPSNHNTIVDQHGNHEDWIELYNAGSTPVDLAGWSLTDNALEPRKWTFEGGTLAPNAYLIVFASDKDIKNPDSTLHTNFKLNATGDYLALFDPSGNKVQELNPIPRLDTDYSYGLLNGMWVEFTIPTAGAQNIENGLYRFPTPIFSVKHGLHDQPFVLGIRCDLPGSLIYYTEDGSVPSPQNGYLYEGQMVVSGTKILRAIAVADPQSEVFYLDSKVATSSYIFPNDVIHQSNTPAGYPKTWGTVASDSWGGINKGDSIPADYEMDPELMAEPAYADSVLRSFTELPIISIVTDKGNLFSKSTDPLTGGIYIYTAPTYGDGNGILGNNWERPVSMELFQAGTDVSMQTDCGLEMHGQASRFPEKSPKHSFKVAFKDEYGIGKLRYPLFGKDGQKSINAFYLRAGFGYTWIYWGGDGGKATYNRDEWVKLAHKRMGQFESNTTYAHLFINGMYWGLYNPEEKVDEDYLQYWFGGKEEDYEVHKNEAHSPNWTKLKNAVSISTNAENYNKLMGCDANGVRNPALPVLIDMDNFIDYMILNFYAGNWDWDHKNLIIFKNKADSTTGFRFMSWDAEMTLASTTENRVNTNNSNAPSGLFNKLKANPLFVRRFMDRVQKHCYDQGWLTPEKAAETWLDLANQIQGALFAESARWGDYRKDVHKSYTAPLYRKDVHYNNQKNWMLKTYFPQRTDILLSQFRNANLLSSVVAPSYRINMKNAGDTILDSQKLTIYAPAGSIYYTLDGTDPVTFSLDGEGKLTAALTPTAQSYPYQYEFAPTQNMHVKSRALYFGTWSALAEKQLVMKTIVGLSIQKEDAGLMAAAFPANFKTETSLRGMIPTAGKVRIELFDVSGKLVAVPLDAYKSAGAFEVVYDGSHLKPGMYICRVQLLGEQNRTTQFKLIKVM